MNDSVIDRRIFAELQAAAGAEFVIELVATFLEEGPSLLAELERARASADAEAFQRAAHSLKSNANTFGALKLAALARELELQGLKGDIGELARLEGLFADAAVELKALSNE